MFSPRDATERLGFLKDLQRILIFLVNGVLKSPFLIAALPWIDAAESIRNATATTTPTLQT